MSKAHVHAAVIHAYADGAEIEFKDHSGYWQSINLPVFKADVEYRVKPVRAYPETLMNNHELSRAYHFDTGMNRYPFRDLANAALRHAIDSFQVVPSEVVERLARKLAESEADHLRSLNGTRFEQSAIERDAKAIFERALAGEV